MTRFMSLIGIILSLAVVLISSFMNYQYMSGMYDTGLNNTGTANINNLVMGVASVMFDGLKALFPFFILAGIKNKKYVLVAIGLLILPALIGFSLISALGFVAKNRNASTSQQQTIAAALADTKAEIKRQRTKLATQPKARVAGVVKQELNAKKQHKRFTSSKQCTEATAKKSRLFCTDYFQLKAEYEVAKVKTAIDSKISTLTAQKEKLLKSGAHKQADPQAGLLAKLTGLKIQDTQTALSVFIAVLVEMVAAFGLYVSTAHSDKPNSTKKRKASNDNASIAKPKRPKKEQTTQILTQEIIFKENPAKDNQPIQLVLA